MALKHNSYILTILHFFCQMGNVQNGEAMKTSSRQILVLQLFEREKPVWTVEQMTRTLRLPESTVYRHVRNLVAAGFLDPVNSAGYSLGPAFIRYESIIRATDALDPSNTPNPSWPRCWSALLRTARYSSVEGSEIA